MGVGKIAAKGATRATVKTGRLTVGLILATATSALWGWFYDRPGLVRDKSLESPFERRAQYLSAVFWPTFACWLAAGAPGTPGFVASLVAPLGAFPYVGWVVIVALFATVVLMRRLMAASGRGWPLRSLVRASRRWLRHYPLLLVGLITGCMALPIWWATADRGEQPIAHAIPVVVLLAVGAVIAMREASWLRKAERLIPRLAQAHKVTESVLDQAVLMPRKGRGFVMCVVPPQVVTHLDGLDGRVAMQMPEFEANVRRNLEGAVTSVEYRPTGAETAEMRDVLARTGGLVVSLAPTASANPARPDEHMAVLADGVTDSRAAEVDRVLRSEFGLTVVEWPKSAREVPVARLDERAMWVRTAFAREDNSLDRPWDLEFLVEEEQITVLRSGAMGGEDKRTDWWSSRAGSILPAEEAQKWVVEDDARTGRVVMKRIVDRLRDIQPYPWDAEPSLTSLPFGVREDGTPLTLGLLEINQLLGGTPGGGKSGGLSALLCGIARLEHVALIGLDPKRVEQEPWKTRFSVIAKDEDFATDVLEAMRDEMERRYVWLEQEGLKKFGPAQFSEVRPLLVLVIDELADLVSVGATKEEKDAEAMRSTLIRRLIAKGRAAGIVVIAATQKPQSDVIPTSLRDLIQLRVAYATTNSDMTDTILGKGMANNGGEAHAISAKQRGVCFIVNETSRIPIRARTYWVPDEEVEGISQRHAHLRVDLPWMPTPTKSPARPAPTPVVGDRPPKAEPTEPTMDLSDFDLTDFEDDADLTQPIQGRSTPSRWDADEEEPAAPTKKFEW